MDIKYIILIVTIGIILSTSLIVILKPNNTVISLKNEENFPILIIEDEIIEDNEPIINNGEIFISYPVFKKYIDNNVFFDDVEKVIIITLCDKIYKFKVNSNIVEVNRNEFKIDKPVFEKNGIQYIPIEVFLDDYGLEINYYEDTNIFIIDNIGEECPICEVIMEDAEIRCDMSKKSYILKKDINVGSFLKIYEEYESWYKVRSEEGILGYIEKKYVKVVYKREFYNDKQLKGGLNTKRKICLAWDHILGSNSNKNNIKRIGGLNVISPTWFSIQDVSGNIRDRGNIEYVNYAHDLGYDVWALVNNNFDPELTHKILSNYSRRMKIIDELLKLMDKYSLEGINIDFENINIEDKELYTQFIREFVPLCHEKGKVVSVDVTVKANSNNWSLCYDRQGISEVADYVIMMAYDQHWSNGPSAGSVAEYLWVENGIKSALKEIPKEKLILGIPFYTRLWKIEKKNGKVSSETFSMSEADKLIKLKDLNLIWDENSGQYYGEYEERDYIYKIWFEDENSIELKMSLVNKYSLAGVAFWRLGFEKDNVWSIINYSL